MSTRRKGQSPWARAPRHAYEHSQPSVDVLELKEVEELEVQVIKTRKKVLRDKHLDTLTSIAVKYDWLRLFCFSYLLP